LAFISNFAFVIQTNYSPELTGTDYHHYYKCATGKNVAKKIKNVIIASLYDN